MEWTVEELSCENLKDGGEIYFLLYTGKRKGGPGGERGTRGG
jgi:hypothetical protein